MKNKASILPELSREEMLEMLQHERVGRIGLNDSLHPYVVPTDFAFLDGAIYIHTPNNGLKAELARKDPHVCFEVDRYNPEVTDYRSIIIRGLISEVADGNEKRLAMRSLAEKAMMSGHPGKEKNNNGRKLPSISIFKIHIMEMTGVKSPAGGHP